jgi:hypothetical protein
VTRVAAVTQNAPAQNTQSQNTQSEGFFSSLARKVGLGGTADTTATTSQPAKPKAAEAKPPRPEGAIPKASAAKGDTKQATAHPSLKPAVTDTAAAAPAPAPAAPSMVAGAQPIVSANSFESRFSAAK